MMVILNRLSWWLIGFAVATSVLALVVVTGAALLIHRSVPLPQIWLVSAGIVAYLLVHESHAVPAGPPAPPPQPEPEVPLQDLDHLRRMWLHGDISEEVYRRAVERATRKYTPPPPPPDPPRRRRW